MKLDFHFYLIYALAERSGFRQLTEHGEKEALIIAYASQYVDDNDDGQVIGSAEEGEPIEEARVETEGATGLHEEVDRYQNFPWAVRVRETGNFFRPVMTQTVSLKSFLSMFQRYLFVAFHFLPGDREKIPLIRGRRNPWATTAHSRNAITVLKDALESDDPYRIGAALHTFADTWSHQNFSGFHDDWNGGSGLALLPDIGHAEVGEKPDQISERWTDRRLDVEVRNIDRAREATKAIFEWLSRYRPSWGHSWEEVAEEMEWLLQARDQDERIERVKGLYPGENLDYDRKQWIEEALEFDPESGEVVAKEAFLSSHWYRFQCAVQKQLAKTLPLFPEGV